MFAVTTVGAQEKSASAEDVTVYFILPADEHHVFRNDYWRAHSSACPGDWLHIPYDQPVVSEVITVTVE